MKHFLYRFDDGTGTLWRQLRFRDRPVSSIFVNREGDLARLAAMLEDPAASGGAVILVEGERGMGKTALCDAFMQRARTLASVRVCYGQSIAHTGDAEPYLPVLDALHHLARQAPATVPAMLARHAPSWLARLPGWVADAAPAYEDATGAESSRMVREAGDFFEAIAGGGRAVIVLDDLQCADLDTVELLRALAKRRPPLRAMVLAIYTPFPATATVAALRRLASELHGIGHSAAMKLQPLRQEHVGAYLAERFGAGPIEALGRMVHQVAGGNPLVMVTTMDALIAEGYIGLHEGRWRLHHSPGATEASLSVPVLDSAQWWFDQLDAGDRASLESAASVGSEFTARDVARVSGDEPDSRFVRRLEKLCDRGFITRGGRIRRGRAAENHTYRFHHPSHVELLSAHAPVVERPGAAARLAPGADVGGRLG